jgi:probable selenate reductase FAD-binding subunit
MLRVQQYYLPHSLDEALSLLQCQGTLPLAGGQYLLASQRPDVQALVDLQAIKINSLAIGGGQLRIGAMVRLQQLVESPDVPPMLAEAARREGALTYRYAATVGGTIVSHDPSSRVLLSLLVMDARVNLRRVGDGRTLGLDELLDDPAGAIQGGLITGVTVPAEAIGTATADVARTPSDRPIVAAAVYLVRAGNTCSEARIALGGVAGRPVRLRSAEARLAGQPFSESLAADVAAESAAGLQPRSDFRGGSEYRRAMAAVLMRRALVEAWSKIP